MSGRVSYLDELIDIDVDTTPPTDGQLLKYDAGSGTWKPGTGTTNGRTVEQGHIVDSEGSVLWRWGVDALGRPYFDDADGVDAGEEANLTVDGGVFYVEEITL